MVLDWDDTCVPLNTIPLIGERTLTTDQYRRSKELRDKHLPLVENGQITEAQYREWMAEDLDLFVQARLSRTQVARAVHDIRLRSGLLATLLWAAGVGIPVAIISAGCRTFIREVLANHDADSFVQEVFAGDLFFEGGIVTQTIPGSIVTPACKGKLALRFAEMHRVPANRILAVGNGLGDKHLAGPEGKLLGIVQDRAAAVRLMPPFHEVIVSNRFDDVLVRITRHINGNGSNGAYYAL